MPVEVGLIYLGLVGMTGLIGCLFVSYIDNKIN